MTRSGTCRQDTYLCAQYVSLRSTASMCFPQHRLCGWAALRLGLGNAGLGWVGKFAVTCAAHCFASYVANTGHGVGEMSFSASAGEIPSGLGTIR